MRGHPSRASRLSRRGWTVLRGPIGRQSGYRGRGAGMAGKVSRRSPDYREGEADGLRIAAEMLRELERNVAERLERPSGRVTREARKVRHKTLQVAARRIETALRQRSPAPDRVTTALRRLGL